MSTKIIVCAPLAMLLACGQPTKPTKEKEPKITETKPTSAAIKPPEPIKPATAPTSTSAPTSASAPAATPGTAAFFAVATADNAVPLACYNATTKTVGKGADCLELVPPGSSLGTSEGGLLRSNGRNTYTCEPSGDTAPSLQIVPDPTRSTWPVAFWPESTKPQWFVVGDKDFNGLEYPDKAAVQASAKKADPKAQLKGFKIHQIVKVDLDGDGKEEELVSAYSLPSTAQHEQTFGALFLRDAADPKQFNLISEGGLEMFEVMGVYDLDQDGKKELILNIYYYEGGAYSIGKLDGGKYVELGVWGCGA